MNGLVGKRTARDCAEGIVCGSRMVHSAAPSRVSVPGARMTTSLYDAIGGLAALEFAVERFSERVATDPDLAPVIAGWEFQTLKNYLVGVLGQAVGGPVRRGGHLMLTPRHFDRIAGHLAGTLRELAIPEALADRIMDRVWLLSSLAVQRRRKPLKAWAAGSNAERMVGYLN